MPLELTKTMQQLRSHQESKMGIVNTLRYVVANKGIRGLFYGLNIQVIQTTGKVAIRFSSFEKAKIMYEGIPGQVFLAGCTAGAAEAALWITPCERLKVLKQAQVSVKSPLHTGWLSSLALILKEQGLSGLYRGLAATVLRNGASIGFRMVLFSHLSNVAAWLRGQHKKKSMWEPFVLGGIVGATSTVLNNPIDVIKSKMQADDQGSGSKQRYRSTIHCAKDILATEGAKGFARGMGARIAKITLGQAVIFFTYENITNSIRKFVAKNY
eukprot:CAMPEP_0167749204 /NCGR_PEP_ID=MMETSP0110_2-20121227/5270_1 /TAXON_ID=629695 /ORGANISM="Gymnochlora sp., Strain CCMP2014" /LENGTH=268 /DNA_ID=CAMNT_0007634317 /DNA_START=99 /DNA_END=905 /DNA_ORIENTATION=+